MCAGGESLPGTAGAHVVIMLCEQVGQYGPRSTWPGHKLLIPFGLAMLGYKPLLVIRYRSTDLGLLCCRESILVITFVVGL